MAAPVGYARVSTQAQDLGPQLRARWAAELAASFLRGRPRPSPGPSWRA